MKMTDIVPALLVGALATTGAWGAQDLPAVDQNAVTTDAAAGAVTTDTPAAGAWNGTVAETMNAGGYTYVLLDTGNDKFWVAATETTVAVGDKVTVPRGMMMSDFFSKTLNRKFDRIYFVEGIYPATAGLQVDRHASAGGENVRTHVADAQVEAVPKAEGGYTVNEILTKSADLKGQTVKVRGRVVKYVPDIMGANWLHIQDGSGGDLAVTTEDSAAKGDDVLVEGVLSVDKDFGAGYVYPAILEKAKVTKE